MDEGPQLDFRAMLPVIDRAFRENVPHNLALNVQIIEAARGMVVSRVPWAQHLVGNPETEALHGGVITTLLDATGGSAVFLWFKETPSIATLDLRVDHLRPSAARKDLYARAECYRVTRNVAFVRGTAWCEEESNPIATMTATFMLGTRGRPAV